MLVAAALALGLVQVPPADDPRAKAAPGAAFVFSQVLLRLNVKQTAAAYAAGSDELGRGVLADTPELKGVLAIDGAGGRGCRVAYIGDQAERAWSGFTAGVAAMTKGAGACTPGPASADLLTATCVSAAESGASNTETRRADLAITRSGGRAQGTIEAMLTNLRP